MDTATNLSPAPAQLGRVGVARGELLDPGSLAALASGLARRQAAQLG